MNSADHADALMTEERSAQRVMLDQQLALGAYLQALLQPAPPESDIAPAPTLERAPANVAESPVAIVAAPAPAVADAAQPQGDVQPVPATQQDQPSPVAVVNEPASSAALPDWARHEFQSLLFRVAGLTLALPLARLNGVLPWDAEAVTPMPNHQPWFLGLREHLDQHVKLIDLAQVVLPADRRPESGQDPSYGKIILIDEGRWGLVCSDVAEVVTLSANAVKWRSGSGSRPWLAGTVIDRMCALIDTAALADMLAGSGPAPL